MPTMSQAGVYSAIMHYLKAISEAKTDDAASVIAKIKATPVDDMFATGGIVREDSGATNVLPVPTAVTRCALVPGCI